MSQIAEQTGIQFITTSTERGLARQSTRRNACCAAGLAAVKKSSYHDR